MSSLASTGHEYGDLPRLPHIIRWGTGQSATTGTPGTWVTGRNT